MLKILKATYPEKCIGCELCLFEAQKQLKKIGLEGALIRILKDVPDGDTKLHYQIHIDQKTTNLDLESIKNICPKAVFIIDEQEEHELL